MATLGSKSARARRQLRFVLAAMLVLLPILTLLPARSGAAMAQESSVDWRLLSDGSAGPGPRWDHTLAADDLGKQLLVFGGRDGNGNVYGDTWLYDLFANEWRQIEGPAPAPRFGQAVAVDRAARTLYLHGGQAGATFFADTWVFSFADESWTRIETGDGPVPDARYGHAAALDGEGHLLITHGFTFDGRFDDTWSLDLESGNWHEVSPEIGNVRPLPRCLFDAIWDGSGERLVLFGGCASGFGPCPLGDLWAFDPESRTWTDVSPADGPAPRMNPALVLSVDGSRAWLIGGLTDGGHVNDLWRLDLTDGGATWEAIAAGVGPAPRSSHDATLSNGRLYLFGGTGAEGAFADLWSAPVE